MEQHLIDFKDTRQFSDLFLAYLDNDDALNEFYSQRPTVEGIFKQREQKKFSAENRKILCQVLEEQYAQINLHDAVQHNLAALSKDNSYTVTTGHQLNIFTGPLYFIYKIASVIKTCKVLQEQDPGNNYIPVYWMASEDHDFEEIAHATIDGTKYEWKTDQTGAVGRMKTDLGDVIDKIPGLPALFKTAYTKSSTLSEAVRSYVNTLFENEGLIILDADDKRLKALFAPVMKDDIFNHTPNDLVNRQSEKLDKLGYKTQVFPREINFFYMKDDLRARIVEEKGTFKILDTEIGFTKEDMQALIQDHPDRFSPNVILRPLYQETILPNLAYFGGPAEVAYWLQLKPVFDHYSVQFPVIFPRNFAAILLSHVNRKRVKSGLTITDLFLDRASLHKKIALDNTEQELLLNGQKKQMLDQFEAIRKKAEDIDPTLGPHVEAQQTMVKHKLENIEKKFIRAAKRRQSEKIGQADDVLDHLYPSGTPQERKENFIPFYLTIDNFIETLIDCFDPFDFRYNILVNGK